MQDFLLTGVSSVCQDTLHSGSWSGIFDGEDDQALVWLRRWTKLKDEGDDPDETF